jgi:cell division protein FtsB
MIELEKQHARVAAARDPQGGWSPVPRFIKLAGDYTKERNLAKDWADAYHPLVEGHFDAAEGYERAQLIAEIGIVLASLAVLLSSRPAWMLSVILSGICVVQLGRTFIHTSSVVRDSHEKIHQQEEAYSELRKGHVGENEDEKAIEQLDADGSIRAAIAERARNREGAETHQEAKK